MASFKVVKAIISAVLLGISAALFIFSCITAIFYTTDPNGVVVTLWQICLKRNGDIHRCNGLLAYDCEEQHDKFSSARAFNIITIILITTGFFFAVLEAFRYKTVKWRVVFSLFAFVSGLVSWSICLSFFTTQHCKIFTFKFSEKHDAKLGGSFPAQFVGWFLVIFAIALEFVDLKKCSKSICCCFFKKKPSTVTSEPTADDDHSPTSGNQRRNSNAKKRAVKNNNNSNRRGSKVGKNNTNNRNQNEKKTTGNY
jgi:hypothetical protein